MVKKGVKQSENREGKMHWKLKECQASSSSLTKRINEEKLKKKTGYILYVYLRGLARY